MVEQNLACFINIFTYRMRLWGCFLYTFMLNLCFVLFLLHSAFLNQPNAKETTKKLKLNTTKNN